MDHTELLAKMRARILQCRRLADATTDPRTAVTLRGMADEGEADLNRLIEKGSADWN